MGGLRRVNVNRLRQDSRLRRRTVLGFYAALVFVAAGGTTVLAWVIPWSHPAHLSDRLAETGDVLAAGTLTLALIAGLVAIQAYAAATGLPDLGVQISFPFSYPNRPVFLAELSDSGSF